MERTITTNLGLDKTIAAALAFRNNVRGREPIGEEEFIISLLSQATVTFRKVVFQNALSSWSSLSSDDKTFVLGKLGLSYISGAETAKQIEVLAALAMDKYLALSVDDQNLVIAKF